MFLFFHFVYSTFLKLSHIILKQVVHDKVVLTLKSLQNYFGVDFPLKKLDIVALPGFSAVKPVDNWGLIVFKYDPNYLSFSFTIKIIAIKLFNQLKGKRSIKSWLLSCCSRAHLSVAWCLGISILVE